MTDVKFWALKTLGSMSDPDDIPGLAHFCEHMAFLGTKKVVYLVECDVSLCKRTTRQHLLSSL
jgi:hypothetical protein